MCFVSTSFASLCLCTSAALITVACANFSPPSRLLSVCLSLPYQGRLALIRAAVCVCVLGLFFSPFLPVFPLYDFFCCGCLPLRLALMMAHTIDPTIFVVFSPFSFLLDCNKALSHVDLVFFRMLWFVFPYFVRLCANPFLSVRLCSSPSFACFAAVLSLQERCVYSSGSAASFRMRLCACRCACCHAIKSNPSLSQCFRLCESHQRLLFFCVFFFSLNAHVSLSLSHSLSRLSGVLLLCPHTGELEGPRKAQTHRHTQTKNVETMSVMDGSMLCRCLCVDVFVPCRNISSLPFFAFFFRARDSPSIHAYMSFIYIYMCHNGKKINRSKRMNTRMHICAGRCMEPLAG